MGAPCVGWRTLGRPEGIKAVHDRTGPRRLPRVLVIEDEAPLRMILEMAFADGGYDALVVGTAGAGLQAIEAQAFDAVVTNVDLGEALDGFDVARRARARNGRLPVIYVTGGAGHRFEAERVDGGVLVNKPYVAADILDRLGVLIEAAEADAPAKRKVSSGDE
jgi:DNA-binding response OmpR family regulator